MRNKYIIDCLDIKKYIVLKYIFSRGKAQGALMTDQMVLVIGLAGIVIFCLLSFIRYGSLIGNVNETKRKYDMTLARIAAAHEGALQRIAQGQPELDRLLSQVMEMRQERDRLYVRLLELEESREKEEDYVRRALTKVER